MTQIPQNVVNGTPEEQANYLLAEMSRMLAAALTSLKSTSADPNLGVQSSGNSLVFTEVNT